MKKKEFGDFQTPDNLAKNVVQLISQQITRPDIIIEPTCGIGNFLSESYQKWNDQTKYFGFELNEEYVKSTSNRFCSIEHINIKQQDFFVFDWTSFFDNIIKKNILVIGNPPWVTNSALGLMGGNNLPIKTNFQGHKGFDAKTGKANFDIAEWITIKLLESTQGNLGQLAFLCKTSTARKVLQHFWKQNKNIGTSKLFLFDAKKYFNVAVDACLLYIQFAKDIFSKSASVYSSINSDRRFLYSFGYLNGELVSDIESYKKYNWLDGCSNYTWRSGIKHDASKIMELSICEGKLVNGIGEIVDIEDKYLYPLLKSSDLGNRRLEPRKYVIATQKSVRDDTLQIKNKAPKTWDYLCKHSSILDNRKSSIYRNRPRFSVFGIGQYSFSNWKVAISGLYKNTVFSAIPPVNSMPTMVDDTCYFIPCASQEEAEYWTNCLNSTECQNFIKSLIFFDSKRPVNIDVLKRIDMSELSRRYGTYDVAYRYLEHAGFYEGKQPMLVFEEQEKYLSG